MTKIVKSHQIAQKVGFLAFLTEFSITTGNGNAIINGNGNGSGNASGPSLTNDALLVKHFGPNYPAFLLDNNAGDE